MWKTDAENISIRSHVALNNILNDVRIEIVVVVVTPLDGYLRKIRRMTSFRAKKVPFGGPDDYILYLDPYIYEKSPFRGQILTGLSFFAAENCFNTGML